MERINAFHYEDYKGFEIWNDEADGMFYADNGITACCETSHKELIQTIDTEYDFINNSWK